MEPEEINQQNLDKYPLDHLRELHRHFTEAQRIGSYRVSSILDRIEELIYEKLKAMKIEDIKLSSVF